MKKLLGIIALGLFLNITQMSFQNAKAGIFDFFKEPVEICMDVFVEEYSYTDVAAARKCRGIDKGELACMKRFIKNDKTPLYSLRKCKSK